MSKSDKIPIQTKKGTCYYGIAASSKVRVGSYGAKKICCWLGRQTKTEKADKDREGKQRQRRQAKTEKAKRQTKTEKASKYREGKKTEKAKKQTGIFKNIRILQWQAGSYRTENQLEIRQAGTLDCYITCQCSALLNGVFVIWNSFHVRIVSFLRIIVSV